MLDAVEKMIAFGRGIIAISQKGDKLTDPNDSTTEKPILRVFGGTDITVSNFDRDFDSPRFYKPIYYTAWGQTIHHSRVIDFTYIKPTDKDRPYFKFGGMSEFQLIYNEIICDGIVQRAGASFIEKSSSLIYKMKEYADYYQRGQESPVNKRVKEAEEKGASLVRLLLTQRIALKLSSKLCKTSTMLMTYHCAGFAWLRAYQKLCLWVSL